MEKNAQALRWYAMNAIYNHSLQMKEKLEAQGVSCFVPMIEKLRTVRGRKVREVAPAVLNLIFVRAEADWLKAFKRREPYLQYMIRREGGKGYPIIVPDDRMESFIRVSSVRAADIHYLAPDEFDLQKGTRVRIHGGPFEGVEGVFVKVKGMRNRRVVVSIPDAVTVATATVEPEFIEVLE